MSAKASRAELNAKAAGARNLLGDKELVQDIAEGKLSLDAVKEDELPDPLKSVSKEERAKLVADQATKRRTIQEQIQSLSDKRQSFITAEVSKNTDRSATLDHKVYTAIKEQAAKKNILYEKGPAY